MLKENIIISNTHCFTIIYERGGYSLYKHSPVDSSEILIKHFGTYKSAIEELNIRLGYYKRTGGNISEGSTNHR